MKQKFYEHLKQNIDYIVDAFISNVGSDFDDLKYSSYDYYYLDYTSLDTTTIDNYDYNSNFRKQKLRTIYRNTLLPLECLYGVSS